MKDSRSARVANGLHSAAIHLLRRARTVDRATGLSPERLSLLSVLCFAGPRTVGELAEAEMVSRPAISRIVNALEGAGLARRGSSEADGRRVVVAVTAKGRHIMDRARKRRLETISAELSGLSANDLAVLEAATAVLGRLGRTGR
jgi:DNA-binding MarR family transcriptional regulator